MLAIVNDCLQELTPNTRRLQRPQPGSTQLQYQLQGQMLDAVLPPPPPQHQWLQQPQQLLQQLFWQQQLVQLHGAELLLQQQLALQQVQQQQQQQQQHIVHQQACIPSLKQPFRPGRTLVQSTTTANSAPAAAAVGSTAGQARPTDQSKHNKQTDKFDPPAAFYNPDDPNDRMLKKLCDAFRWILEGWREFGIKPAPEMAEYQEAQKRLKQQQRRKRQRLMRGSQQQPEEGQGSGSGFETESADDGDEQQPQQQQQQQQVLEDQVLEHQVQQQEEGQQLQQQQRRRLWPRLLMGVLPNGKRHSSGSSTAAVVAAPAAAAAAADAPAAAASTALSAASAAAAAAAAQPGCVKYLGPKQVKHSAQGLCKLQLERRSVIFGWFVQSKLVLILAGSRGANPTGGQVE
jgi:hypothetical protein